MATAHTESPRTEAEWRAALAERDAIIEAQRQTIEALRAESRELKKQLALLRREVNRLLKGGRLKPTIEEGQGLLFEDATEDDTPSADEPTPEHLGEAPDGETPEDRIKNKNKPKRPSRKLDASALPRETVVHELPEDQRVDDSTGLPLVPVGEKVTEELEYTRAKLHIIEHRRVVYGLAPEDAKERRVEPRVAPSPAQPIEGCRAGAGLLAQILVQKYVQHLPLYRQEEAFRSAGLEIPRSTLCDWVLRAAWELRPIVRALEDEIRAGPVLQLDDTRLNCQGPKGSGVFQAYLWVLVNPEVRGVVYRFTPGRGAAEIVPFLEGYEGYLVGDGYAGHFAAARKAEGCEVVHGGCWAHSTRKFRDAGKEGGRMAQLFRDDIAELYAIDRKANALADEELRKIVAAREAGTITAASENAPADHDAVLLADLRAKHRYALRNEEARPVLLRMILRTRGWKAIFHKNGKMGEALTYLRKQGRRLRAFLKDGRIPLDNNACEQSIRPVALGRKNWLFAGSQRGGEAAAIAYSLVQSCRLLGVDPWDYLSDVLSRVGTHPASRIAELIPARWAIDRGLPLSG